MTNLVEELKKTSLSSFSPTTPLDQRWNGGCPSYFLLVDDKEQSLQQLGELIALIPITWDSRLTLLICSNIFSQMSIPARTYTALKINENGHFKFCFMAIGASIEGWRCCRPTISVDGMFLKSKFGDTLLSASILDGAFAIVDSKNDVSWKWFFEHIQTSLEDREYLVIVSYRHLSIPNGVLSVFNNVEYCVCIQHILRNLKKLFKDPLIDQLYFSCVKSYTVDDFEFNMRFMKSISPNIRSYLINVGFEKWSRAYSGRRMYEMMTINPSECVNSVLKDNRNLPVASLLDAIRGLLQKWFHDRRKASLSMTTILTPWAKNILCNQHEQSRSFMVHPIDNVEYSVMDGDIQFLVKLNFGSCSCRVWDFEDIPCSHALAILCYSENEDTYELIMDIDTEDITIV
ncbi:uncharacterized protein LOC120084653 [Benincasa hispida]|uniref:uncharacterized protein LOC120084653 n=1 Tax=Benincasa hispida TaxID=102211 RepID=UPI0019016D2A|nr:uncharacterized protein LOC120084653 [Benincasa hispida]